MIILLISSLLLLILFNYIISDRNLFSPVIMTSIGYLISLLILIINSNSWNYNMSFKTFMIILTSIIALGFGELFARLTYKKVSIQCNNLNLNREYYFIIKQYKTIMVIIFMSLFTLYYYFDIKRVASNIGFGSFIEMISSYNKAQKYGFTLSTISTIGYSISFVIFNIYMYMNLEVIINKIRKLRLIEIIPIIIYLVIVILSSNRMVFIYIIITGILMAYIIWMNKYNWKKRVNIKIIKYSIFLLIAFFIIFMLLGLMTGKTQHFNSPFESISVYTSGSIIALDNFLDSFRYSIDNFGSETLYGLSRVMEKLGVDVVISKRNLPQTYISSDLMTNIYTSIRRYVHDYNYIGMYLIQIIIGYCYTKVLKNIEIHKYKSEKLIIIIYSSFYYPVLMQFIDDLTLTEFISQTCVFKILAYIIFYKLLISKKTIDVNYKCKKINKKEYKL